MDKVLADAKVYEGIVIQHNPQLSQVIASIPIVKEFIRKRGLIIYGGTAIDYALRLKGDYIYPDSALEIPDLDFYSPAHVEDTYDLVDILYKLGHTEAAGFRAMYVLAMRIDIGGKNIVADIGYVPKDVFEHIPTVLYEGMKVMHPHYQMIDVHSSLSFPYDEAPMMRESLFNRWKKDITRYNKLYSYYPLEPPDNVIESTEIAVDTALAQNVFAGYTAYALVYERALQLVAEANMEMPSDIIEARCRLGAEGLFVYTIGAQFELIHTNIDAFAKQFIPNTKYDKYTPYKDILPSHIRTTIKSPLDKGISINLRVWGTENRLVGVSSVRLGGRKLRCVCIHHIMMMMLARYHTLEGAQSATAVAYYLSCKKLIEVAEKAIVAITKSKHSAMVELAEKLPFFPSIHTYGGANYSDATDYSRRRADEVIDGIPAPPTPTRYEPQKGRARPTFDYTASKYFDRNGEKII